MWSQTEICMSTIWKAFLPAQCLQQSQITEVYNTSSNINDTFYSTIHPRWSWSALQVHHIKFFWSITGTGTRVLVASPAQHECRQVSGYAARRRAPPLSTVPKYRYLLWQKKQFSTSKAHHLAARVTTFCYSWEDLFYFRFCHDRGGKPLFCSLSLLSFCNYCYWQLLTVLSYHNILHTSQLLPYPHFTGKTSFV